MNQPLSSTNTQPSGFIDDNRFVGWTRVAYFFVTPPNSGAVKPLDTE
jgi:hypothetical protein